MLERAKLELSRAEVMLKAGIKSVEALRTFLVQLTGTIEHLVDAVADEQEKNFDKHLVSEGYIDDDVFELYYHLKMLTTMDFEKTSDGFKAGNWKSTFEIDNELLEEYFRKVKSYFLETAEKTPITTRLE